MRSIIVLFAPFFLLSHSCSRTSRTAPIRVVAEMDIGESQEISLSNGKTVHLELLGMMVERDSVCNGVRNVRVNVRIDGEEVTLGSGNYNLPVETGNVQIDCPVTSALYKNTGNDRWSLSKDARFRLWPTGSVFTEPGTFVYPIRQEWLASMSQCSNEPTYVDWGENPASKRVYYHSGHDIGGAEGMDEIISATSGLVVSANSDTLEGYLDFPGDIRPDVVLVLTDYGWYIRYSHLDSTDPAIQPGARVEPGQKIGYIGKQGQSGGWVHLHFEIKTKEGFSGTWGTEDAYPYVWESYVRQYDPAVIAVARPHHLLWTGQKARLDGRRSRSLAADIESWQWILSDGTTAEGSVCEKHYTEPGEYSEILKVTDTEGNIDYDFTVVQVYDRDKPGQTLPVLQPAYHPTLDIKPGDPVTFLVRSFNTGPGVEVWDFGDGSPEVAVASEPVDRRRYQEGKFAETTHSFSGPGDYIVSVQRTDEKGVTATAHLHVAVKN